MRNRKGFTLVELMVVIAIIGIVASITVPVSVTMVRRGQQTNRSNIARNIYVLVQNYLTSSALERNLNATVAGHNFDADGNLRPELMDASDLDNNNVVAHQLDANSPVGINLFPQEDIDLENADFVRFLSKPRDYDPNDDCPHCAAFAALDPDCDDPQHMFFDMLDYLILDSEILREAILIEYNIRTGMVMSVFYGNADQEEFTYMDRDDDDTSNITGPRGRQEYEGDAITRRQGYYGVRETGVPLPSIIVSFDVANIFDGANPEERLKVASDEDPLNTNPYDKINVLYAEFLLEGTDYTLELICSFTSNVIATAPPADLTAVPTNFYTAATGGSRIYRDTVREIECAEVQCDVASCEDIDPVTGDPIRTGICQNFQRYIWILDYIGESGQLTEASRSMINNMPFQYDLGVSNIPFNVRARATRPDGIFTLSSTVANTLFARELSPGNFEITSARHLNNLRFTLRCSCHPLPLCTDPAGCDGEALIPHSYSYRQTADINMMLANNRVTRFTPLGTFRGSYRALSVVGSITAPYSISNININAPCASTPCGVVDCAHDNVGLFYENRGFIDGLLLSNAAVTGHSGGTVAGINSGTISRVVIESSTLTMTGGASSPSGGITGRNNMPALIRDCVVRDTIINVGGAGPAVGGIAGVNDAFSLSVHGEYGIHRSSVEHSIVRSLNTSAHVGGIAGRNTGDIADVYFLSALTTTAEPFVDVSFIPSAVPISAQGGGIVGFNNVPEGIAGLERGLFLAPAPRVCEPCDIGSFLVCTHPDIMKNLYPITRSGINGVNCFFLSGYNYKIYDGDEPEYTDGLNYNFSRENHLTFRNVKSEYGLISDFLNKTWIESISDGNDKFSNWRESPNNVDYPYPVIRTLTVPSRYPRIGDRDDIDRAFLNMPDPGNRMRLDFINGDFNMQLFVPWNRASDNPENTNARDTRLAGERFNFNNTTGGPNSWHSNNPAFLQGSFDTRIGANNVPGTAPATHPALSTQFWVYYHQDFVQGWSARPVNFVNPSVVDQRWFIGTTGTTIGRAWEAFEFQKPTTGGTEAQINTNRARRAYNGSATEAYAELNAQLESTLYQICQTEHADFDPRQQFYYSFNHLARRTGVGTGVDSLANSHDVINFYLTSIPDQPYFDPLDGRYHAGYTNLTMIRPCWSPRANGSGTTDPGGTDDLASDSTHRSARWYNTRAAESVRYGSSVTISGDGYTRTIQLNSNEGLRRYWSGQTPASPFYDNPELRNPFAGATWGNAIFVYDVWVGGAGTGNGNRDANGFGITFWSHTNLTLGTAGQAGTNTRIPLEGITLAQFENNTWTWIAQAKNNIFGYWDVNFGWKNYYGMFTVPPGQEFTEFAFQAARGSSPTEGNYLAGVEFFSAPSFLTISTDIKLGANVANFVIPGQILTIEHVVANRGQTPAGRIIIENQLAPFHELMNYSGNLSVVGRNADGTALSLPAQTRIEPNTNPDHVCSPNFDECTDHTLRITFPNNFSLPEDATITVSFNVTVRESLRSEPGVDTWMYVIKSQGQVAYSDSFRQFRNTEGHCASCLPNRTGTNRRVAGRCINVDCKWLWNVSTVSEANISQVQLFKTVENSTGENTLLDGPFKVTLTITNTGDAPAVGVITDTVPQGFTISNLSGTSRGFSRSVTGLGRFQQEQITIHEVNVNPGQTRVFTYTLRSLDANNVRYGISEASTARYFFSNGDGRANMKFPTQVIGLTVKADNLVFDATPSNNSLSLLPATSQMLNADEWLVMLADAVLTDEDGNRLPATSTGNPQGGDTATGITAGGVRWRVELQANRIIINFNQPDPDDHENDAARFNTAAFSTTIYYRLDSAASKDERNFVLSSPVRQLEVNFIP
jgi:prepilin-type N-terminal cleavage/methylation domain-containing protein